VILLRQYVELSGGVVLAGSAKRAAHIGAVEILAQVHQREKGAQDPRF
jgi:hypothetical protein